MPRWKKLQDIPELAALNATIPLGYNRMSNATQWIIMVIAIFCTGIFLWLHTDQDEGQPVTEIIPPVFIDTPVLKQVNSGELYAQFSPSIFLIRHDFLYQLTIGSKNLYFNSYNEDTGLPEEYGSVKEMNRKPAQMWGTGFLINNEGQIMTSRHVIDSYVSDEIRDKIIGGIKADADFQAMMARIKLKEIFDTLDLAKRWVDHNYQ